MNSLWTLHDTEPRLQNKTIRSILWHDPINYPLVPEAGIFWYLYKDANELFKPNASKRSSFTLFVWQSQARGPCQKENVHLYTVSSVDKIAQWIYHVNHHNSYLFLTRHNIHFQHNEEAAISSWTPGGGAYIDV